MASASRTTSDSASPSAPWGFATTPFTMGTSAGVKMSVAWPMASRSSVTVRAARRPPALRAGRARHRLRPAAGHRGWPPGGAHRHRIRAAPRPLAGRRTGHDLRDAAEPGLGRAGQRRHQGRARLRQAAPPEARRRRGASPKRTATCIAGASTRTSPCRSSSGANASST